MVWAVRSEPVNESQQLENPTTSNHCLIPCTLIKAGIPWKEQHGNTWTNGAKQFVRAAWVLALNWDFGLCSLMTFLAHCLTLSKGPTILAARQHQSLWEMGV